MSIYFKSGGTWKLVNQPYIKIGGHWTPSTNTYLKSAGHWVTGFDGDHTPPARPIAQTAVAWNADSPYRFKISVQKSADTDVDYIYFAGKETTFPTGPTDIHGFLINSPLYRGGGAFDASGISSTSLTYVGDFYVGTGAVPGNTYCFSWWSHDTSGNFSTTSLSQSVVFPDPVTVGSIYLLPQYSTSYSPGYSDWRDTFSPPEYEVYQGGSSAHDGMYFHGAQLFNQLAGKTITKMLVYIYRVNTAHGVAGAANVYLAHHPYAVRPDFNPPQTNLNPTFVGTLNRGEGKWFAVPSAWWQPMANSGPGSNYRGLGLYTTSVGTSSSNYVIAARYNAGLSSGKIYVQYHT